MLIIVERGKFDEVVVVVVVIGGESHEEIVGIIKTPLDTVAVAVVLVEVTLHQFTVTVVELHLGVVAGVVVFVYALFSHGAVGGKALLFDETVVLIARGLFLGHVVTHKDGALDAVAVLVVKIGGTAGKLLGAVVFIPA